MRYGSSYIITYESNIYLKPGTEYHRRLKVDVSYVIESETWGERGPETTRYGYIPYLTEVDEITDADTGEDLYHFKKDAVFHVELRTELQKKEQLLIDIAVS